MRVSKWEEWICGNDRTWLVDLDTDEWIRVVVIEEPGFVRGSGMWEPQWFVIDRIHMYKNGGKGICLCLGDDYSIAPTACRPTIDVREDIPLDVWLEQDGNADYFNEYIDEIISIKLEAFNLLAHQVKEVCNDAEG